jgi:succinyl-CoA synthetase alpha subunit
MILSDDRLVLIQGMTGRRGRYHTARMTAYGTQIVGGVSPGRGGDWVEGKPVFDSVEIAVETTGANTSIIFVPPAYAADAIYEAIDAGIDLIICITEGIPIMDMLHVYHYAKNSESRLIGPNCPGVLSPGKINLGIIPVEVASPGHVGVVSKSGALTYDLVNTLSDAGIGQSTIVGIGADPVLGTSFVDILEMFESDPETDSIVLLGEIGGRAEIDAANYIQSRVTKRVIAFVAGRTAPTDRRMGHAGAIIERGYGTADEKIDALKKAGVQIVLNPERIVTELR